MAAATAATMDALDIAAFLASREAGVLAMTRDGRVYAVPVSFTYDEQRSFLYFRLGFGPDSQKRSYVESVDAASFVVYDRTDEGWKSVVAEGHLEALSASTLDSTVVEAVERLSIPQPGLHRRADDELEHAIVRLDVEKLSGVVERRPDG